MAPENISATTLSLVQIEEALKVPDEYLDIAFFTDSQAAPKPFNKP